MRRNYLIYLWLVTFLSSCIAILSTNVPGTLQKSFPQEWIGKYKIIVETPDEGPDSSDQRILTIESKRMSLTGGDRDISYSLDDSLRYSVSGQNKYIALIYPDGLYAIAKMSKGDKGLEMRIIVAEDEDVKQQDLAKYFDNVQKITKKDDRYVKVTINEKKLDEFFKSPVASKDVVVLVPLK